MAPFCSKTASVVEDRIEWLTCGFVCAGELGEAGLFGAATQRNEITDRG